MTETQDVHIQIGFCSDCKQRLVRAIDMNSIIIDTWHPYDVQQACPSEPRQLDFEAWQEWHQSGKRSGRPGHDKFVINVPPTDEMDGCYICGDINDHGAWGDFEGDETHQCPSGLTREQARAIRLEGDRHRYQSRGQSRAGGNTNTNKENQ